MDRYRNFDELQAGEREGSDYRIVERWRRRSRVAIIAPHGGQIETATSAVARAIASDRFNLYLFEGRRASENYARLHITSGSFDEPRCIGLVSRCDTVLAVHGCKGPGICVLLGGLDRELKNLISQTLKKKGIRCHIDGHDFPGTSRSNICNRGRRRQGVQLELTQRARRGAPARAVVAAVHEALRRSDRY
jgi:phage replication-related protein YjqB (UPF0714/DUF867 family)